MEGYTGIVLTEGRLTEVERLIKQLDKRVSELERARQEWHVAGLDRVKGLIEPMAEEFRAPKHG
jgi:16S rRNA U516 pseudouridylate synthase RsuA-like enzyme